eukprot:scaffold63912_cov37-Attheya_sp.AAC.1
MIQIQATIKEENPWVIRSAREHDQHIMDIVLQSLSIPEKDYAELNYCRMYLRITTLSDITTSDGKQIMDDILKGNRDLSNHVDPTEWPHQENPDKPTWTKWEKAYIDCAVQRNSPKTTPAGEMYRCTGVKMEVQLLTSGKSNVQERRRQVAQT